MHKVVAKRLVCGWFTAVILLVLGITTCLIQTTLLEFIIGQSYVTGDKISPKIYYSFEILQLTVLQLLLFFLRTNFRMNNKSRVLDKPCLLTLGYF